MERISKGKEDLGVSRHGGESVTVKDGVDGYRDLWGWGIGILEVGTRKGTLLCRGRICNFFLLLSI